jgi:EAL and modified HD-GYP domain-containing signal transduction protein
MTHSSVLGQVALGYSPMIDRHKAITALRLTVFPTNADNLPDAQDLLAALAEAWPEPTHRLSLNMVGESLLDAVLRTDLPLNMMLEVPAFVASNLASVDALTALHTRGNTLLIKGRPLQPLPREVLPCFAYSIIDLSDERRDGLPPPGGVSRNIPHVQAGVETGAQMAEAFGRGAIAVLGWPIDDPTPTTRPSGNRGAQPELSAVVELINRLERQEGLDRLEAVMKNDPTMAFRLMRYINSPAFGLSVEVTSFRHAIMLLGYQRLKRWLALLLATGSRDPGMKPVIYAAVRRGLLMEELGRDSGCDDERRGEMFICGVFSLLDRLMHQPFAELLKGIPASEAVRAALVDDSGPHQPYLALVRAIEAASLLDMREATDALMMTPQAVNQAVLRALVAARQLD